MMKDEGEELAKLLGKEHRYAILVELYPDSRSYVTELAGVLDIDRRNLGRYLKELQEKGLVSFSEEQRPEGGKPYRYYHLTDSGKKIIATFKGVTTKVEEVGPEKWQINKIVDLLEDQTLSTNLKEAVANRFFSICQQDPIYMTENEKVREIFEDMIENLTQFNEKVVERLRASISASFTRLLTDKNRGKWVLAKLYPSLVRCLDDETKDQKLRTWALRKIGDICRIGPDQQIQKKAREKIFEVYFSSEINSDSKLGEEAKQQLVWATSKDLFEMIQEKTKSSDALEKTKAEMLIEEMIKTFGFKKSEEVYV